MDRRRTLQWVLALGATWSTARYGRAATVARPYGSDPHLLTVNMPGTLWPLTLTPEDRRLAGVLSDIIIPADEHSPSATQAGVVDFVDEWISAPYRDHEADKRLVLDGFAWLNGVANKHGGARFEELSVQDQLTICDSICSVDRAPAEFQSAARFFARYRDLTAGAFY